MAIHPDVSQMLVEVVAPAGPGRPQISQELIEITAPSPNPRPRISQALIEIATPNITPIRAKISQMLVEVATPNTGGLAPIPVGALNIGMWFDFTQQSRFGNPLAGEIQGMYPSGIAALRGQYDDGNVVWGSAVVDQTGKFGVGFSDLGIQIVAAGLPISTVWAGKADLFDDIFGPETQASEKVVQDGYLLVQLLSTDQITTIDFMGILIVDLSQQLLRVISQPLSLNPTGGIWGIGLWGTMLWGQSTGSQFAIVKIPIQNSRGHIFQLAVTETSTLPWLIMGYNLLVNPQKVSY